MRINIAFLAVLVALVVLIGSSCTPQTPSPTEEPAVAMSETIVTPSFPINTTTGCSPSVINPLNTNLLSSYPRYSSHAEDITNDFMLVDPIFLRNFDGYISEENFRNMPPEVDIVSVKITERGTDYCFRIQSNGNNVASLLVDGSHSILYGVQVDIDLNGRSDLAILTTDRQGSGAVVSPEFDMLGEVQVSTEGNSVTLCTSKDRLGEHFDWLAFSGYAPVLSQPHASQLGRDTPFYTTPLTEGYGVFAVPLVDLVTPNLESAIAVTLFLTGSGMQCQATGIGMNSCPPGDNPPSPTQPLDTDTYCTTGWLYQGKICGDYQWGIWCACGGYYGTWVQAASDHGWIGICPYVGGDNNMVQDDTNNDGIDDWFVHDTYDGRPWVISTDDDLDGKFDVMRRTYQLGSFVSTCNEHYDYNALPSQNPPLSSTCCQPRKPYLDFQSGIPHKVHNVSQDCK